MHVNMKGYWFWKWKHSCSAFILKIYTEILRLEVTEGKENQGECGITASPPSHDLEHTLLQMVLTEKELQSCSPMHNFFLHDM